ncbi:MAG: sigma-70 family RNA polymerase sigma factor [Acidobacteriota bacterium]|nr:sigma-70 family RNA polymerase sigma factor [Acidobacteriota bacterium]
MYRSLLPTVRSYDAAIDASEDKPLLSLLADDGAESQDKRIYDEEIRSILITALSRLPERERLIIDRRFGFTGDTHHTLKEVSQILHCSRERVRQLEKVALTRLRQALNELRPELYVS